MVKLTLSSAKWLVAVALVYFSCCMRLTEGQENAQLQIPPSLVECYNTSYFMNRDNRLPNNIETLITLIEKVENSYAFNQDITQLSVALLHRFRQDGIQRAPGIAASAGVLPYSPTGFQFPKFRILLSRLIPGNANRFPNDTLTREERCSLHFMLSSSIDNQVRGDENQVCNSLAQYRSQRFPRDLNAPHQRRNNFIGDVEILDDLQTRTGGGKRTGPGAQQRVNAKTFDFDYMDGNGYSSPDNSISQCPVENGVIRTKWGTVAAGNLIAGIAAGLQPQTVQLRTLLALASRRPGYVQNMPQMATVSVDNRWAATLAGDLAEVSLIQVPTSAGEQATVGATGAWNSTVMPKWYFLSQRQNMEMTDAEIRGGLDGLIIALNIGTWRQQVSSLKLSQLLRMYYSLDGVLSTGIMACNRANYFQQNIQVTTLNAQTSAFAQVLDREMQLRVTLQPDAIARFAAAAATALTNYIPSMNDLSCSVSNAVPQDVSENITPMTNIYVFLDTTWQYTQIVDYVNYVLESININPYASSVTLLCAQDGSVIVNTTNYISDVFEGWNISTHATYAKGFNLATILKAVTNITYNYMNVQKANSSVGGLSMVALLMPYMTTISDSDSNYATTQLQYISEQAPDLRFIYYAGGSVSRFSSFVKDPTQDLYPLSIGTNAATAGGPVVMRIKKLPRQIVNPRCGATWYSSSYGTDQMAQYARPGVINFYRMAPNYFYGAGTGRYLNIQSQSSVQYTVCTSRSIVLPQQQSSSSSNSSQTCVQLQGNTFSYDLSSACSGYYTIHQCPALYVSVQAPATSNTQSVSCTDPACQTPDQSRYIMSVVNLGCNSGVTGLAASVVILLLTLITPLSNNFSGSGIRDPTGITNRTSILTDIFVFLDTSWEYKHVVDYVNYVVEDLNIQVFGSSVTLLAARDGSVMVNRTFYLTEFYENWNATTHALYRSGFSLPLILSKARDLAQDILDSERNTGSLGARSLIALLVPSPNAFVHEYDFDYCQNFVKSLNITMPDLKFLYYAGGAVIRFMDYVSSPTEDIFPLDLDRAVVACGEPVVKRIRKVPRRLTNPRCSSKWSLTSQGSNELQQYEGLGKINFYRLSPNYFYGAGSMRYLKVKPISSVVFTVCSSRNLPWPYRNPTSPFTNGQECKQLSSGDFSYDLTEMCTGYERLLDCPPLYISVQAQAFADISQLACTKDGCPSPSDTEYLIFVNNLECSNGGHHIKTVGLAIIFGVFVCSNSMKFL